jgi:hypothetical protein
LRFKRSAVPAKVPSLADLSLGELAINTFDGKVYMRKDDGTASIVEVGGGAGVLSFNSRTGAVTLTSGDVTTALGYTPVNRAGDTMTGTLNLQDTSGTASAMARYISFRGAGMEERGWVGFGYGTTQFGLFNNLGDVNVFGAGNINLITNGAVTSNTSFRAPIFYDSNDTSYYLDPATTSNLQNVQMFGSLNMISGAPFFISSSTGAFQRVDGRNDGSDARSHWYGVTNTGATSNFRHAWYDGSAYFNITATGGQIYFERGGGATINANGDFRAPIFYDSNDTSYYLDPNSTSVLNAINVWGEIGPRRGDGQSLLRSYNISAGGPLQFYLDHSFGNVNIGNNRGAVFADGTYWQIANSVRSPVFYDSNDTGYYVDPNGTTNLVNLFVGSGEVLGTASAFNNMNQIHGTYQDADLVGNFGFRYLQGAVNGPAISGATQYYGMTLGLGSEYAFSAYASQFYWPRTPVGGLPYPSVRFKEGGPWGAWSKIYAGWADAPSGATFAASGDFRAPIFYDSDNTASYLDPASTSVINILRANTIQHSSGNTAIALDGPTWTQFCDPNGATKLWLGGSDPNNYYNGNTHFFRDAASSVMATIDANGIQAPIYYDRNNTAYYVDANNTSVLWEAATYYLRNIESVSVNHPYGIYFSNDRSSAYAIFRESGAWDFPFPDLRIAFHTGIKIGANASYQGVRFYTDYDMVTQVMSVNNGSDGVGAGHVFVNNVLQAGGDLRAPIFYDSNNTAFYLDPNGTCFLNAVNMGPQTWRSDITWNNAVNIIVPTSAECSFDVSSGGTWQVWDSTTPGPMIQATAGNQVQIGQAGSRGLYVFGAITASGNVTAFSDIRVKDNVEQIEGALDRVSRIRGVTYTRADLEDKDRRYGGVIAQEIEQVLPEAIFEQAGMKAVDYNATIGLLIEAIKELTNEIETLKADIRSK